MPCRSHVKQTKKWRKEISRTHTQATSSPPTSLSPEIQIHFALVTSFGTCMCIEFSDSKVLVCHKSTSPHNHQHTHALSQSADKFILIRSGFYFSFFHECRLPSPSPKIRASLPPSPIWSFPFFFPFFFLYLGVGSTSACRQFGTVRLCSHYHYYYRLVCANISISIDIVSFIQIYFHRLCTTVVAADDVDTPSTDCGLWHLDSRADKKKTKKKS